MKTVVTKDITINIIQTYLEDSGYFKIYVKAIIKEKKRFLDLSQENGILI